MDASGFLSNHAGGVLGGISTGQEVVVRLAVKPTPSIALPQRTVDVRGEEREIVISGRHDPCIAFRLVPVAEAMLALVLVDAVLEQAAYGGQARK
jgi:chorismate synthase